MLNIIHYYKYANQKYNDLTLVRMAIIKKSTNNECWRGVEKREPFCTVGGNVN